MYSTVIASVLSIRPRLRRRWRQCHIHSPAQCGRPSVVMSVAGALTSTTSAARLPSCVVALGGHAIAALHQKGAILPSS